MRLITLAVTLFAGCLLIGRPGVVAAQRLPARSLGFDLQGTDSATRHPIAIRLTGKAVGPKGRQYAGTCSIQPNKGSATASPLAGEWQLAQNSAAALAGGARPAIAGVGTRAGAKPLKTGQMPTAAGQNLNFTIEARPDGQYQVLLLDAFTDESLEFTAPAPN